MLRSTRTVVGLLTFALLPGCASEAPSQYYDLVASFRAATLIEAPDGPPRADPGARLLFLPAGSTLTYSFEAYRETTLAFERMTARGTGVRLEVSLSSDEDDGLFEGVLDRAGGQRAIDLPFEIQDGASMPVSLTLTVDGTSPAPGDGVLLTGPTLRGLVPAAVTEAPASFQPPESHPNVIIYLIDTLRRDRLGTYGYERPVSPHIDEFAENATVFENAIGQASWTKPSVASVFTGVWPPVHEATHWSRRLPKRFDTLAERLSAVGYETAAFVTNANVSPAFGFDQGFEHFWLEKKHHSDLVNDEVFSFLEARDQDRPLLLYVHTMDPHAGYDPKEPFRSRLAPTADQMEKWRPRWKWPTKNLPFLSDLYDAEIAQNDDAFGVLMANLRSRELFESSLIVVLSDHGEEFREHNGWRHGRVLHHGSLNVPIIVKLPGQVDGSRSLVPASHVDVLPTILDVAGLDVEVGLDGQSLASPIERPVFSHLRLGRTGKPADSAPLQLSVVSDGWKLIQVHGPKARTLLFDVTMDPGETTNLASSLPVRTALLEGLLRERMTRLQAEAPEEIELTDELKKALRDLGYL